MIFCLTIALREVLPSYLKGFVTVACESGWRVSEIRDLKWAQVDLDNNIVRIESGETKKTKHEQSILMMN